MPPELDPFPASSAFGDRLFWADPDDISAQIDLIGVPG
jgi:hypothetical protein